jgi:glycosyltransferase involved in cell wall biosynthesis
MKKIALVGIVGIPPKYGGFETLAYYLVTMKKDTQIKYSVFCSGKIFQKRTPFLSSELCFIPLKANGIQGIFYDIWALLKSLKYDSILILGVSGCMVLPFIRLMTKAKLIVNIDGIEYKRDKWGKIARFIYRESEKIAVKYAHEIIADNNGIAKYVHEKYGITPSMIPYGGDHSVNINLSPEIKLKYNIPDKYAFKVCRIEPENNIALILDTFSKISNLPLVIIGNWNKNKYGRNLKNKYHNHRHLHLLDPIYEQDILNQIRSNCYMYIHGHTAGGTNPSLVEAMYLGLPIIAFDVIFNRETTLNKALYFKNSVELESLINSLTPDILEKIGKEMHIIAKDNYTWLHVVIQYEKLF